MGLRNNMECVFSLLFDSAYRFNYLAGKGFYHSMSDEELIRKQWRLMMKSELNLKNPQTICEKIQWLKLNDRKPIYNKMADKYEAKKFVSDKVGEKYVIPLLGVWDRFEDIDFDALPNSFVLKCTHDSGGMVVVPDKSKFNKRKAQKKINKSLSRNYYWGGREWVYKDIKPRIIAEKYIDSLGKSDSVEYKLACFNGKYEGVTICKGIAHDSLNVRTNDHFDKDFNQLHFEVFYKTSGEKIERPKELDEMIEIAEKLAVGVPYLRVDMYVAEGRVYFGEMTFYTWNGFMKFEPKEWDKKMGDLLDISVVK